MCSDRQLDQWKRDSCDGAVNVWSAFIRSKGVMDLSDGVRRCVHCLWEIVGNECTNCGTFYRPEHDDAIVDSDMVSYDDNEAENDRYMSSDEEKEDGSDGELCRADSFLDTECESTDYDEEPHLESASETGNVVQDCLENTEKTQIRSRRRIIIDNDDD